jgi:hypothetical protein
MSNTNSSKNTTQKTNERETRTPVKILHRKRMSNTKSSKNTTQKTNEEHELQ